MSYLVALKYELACHFFLLHLPNRPWSNSISGNYTKPAPVIILNLSCVIVMRFLHDVPPLCLYVLHPCCWHVSRASGHRRLLMFSSLRRLTTLYSIRHRGWRYGPWKQSSSQVRGETQTQFKDTHCSLSFPLFNLYRLCGFVGGRWDCIGLKLSSLQT